MKSHYIIPIFVPHKGCPHDCVFCNQKHITGQEGQDIDGSFVESEIGKYLRTIPKGDRFVEVSFYGGSFTGIPMELQTNLLKPAKRALDRGDIDAIRLSTRPDCIDDDILANLKAYGVSIIELGVQSMDKVVLLRSARGHSVEDVYRACNLIKDYGFTLGLQMMVGLPGDSPQKDIATAMEFVKIHPQMVRIYPALVIKDTYMEVMYKKGLYTPDTLEESVETCSKLYLIFEYYGIKIIRIGLQATENISPGKDLVAGPFHPAFRELVESKIFNDMIKYMYENQMDKDVEVRVNPGSVSKVYCDKKRYFLKMAESIGQGKVIVKADELIPRDSIEMINSEISQIMSIKDYFLIELSEGIFNQL